MYKSFNVTVYQLASIHSIYRIKIIRNKLFFFIGNLSCCAMNSEFILLRNSILKIRNSLILKFKTLLSKHPLFHGLIIRNMMLMKSTYLIICQSPNKDISTVYQNILSPQWIFYFMHPSFIITYSNWNFLIF